MCKTAMPKAWVVYNLLERDEKFMPRSGKSPPAHHKIYKHVSVYTNNDGDNDASYAEVDVLYVKE